MCASKKGSKILYVYMRVCIVMRRCKHNLFLYYIIDLMTSWCPLKFNCRFLFLHILQVQVNESRSIL